MRALVISGGGSKGAFAGGVAEYLINTKGIEYDLFVGSSTGSLLVSHLALNEIEAIKEIYLNVTQADIFRINPFKVKRQADGVFEIKINHWNTLKSFLLKRQTFGDSRNLRKLIKRAISPQLFDQLQEGNKQVLISVANLTKFKNEFKSSRDYQYTDYIDWIWASANYVPFMSIVNKHQQEYADGGFGSHTPIQAAIDMGAQEVDVIVLEPENLERQFERTSNPFASLMRVFSFMTEQIYYDDLTIGRLKSEVRNVQLNFYHTPHMLTDFPFVFHPPTMKSWWELGYNHAQAISPRKQKV